MKLTAPHVDRHNVDSTILERHVGEPSGGRSCIEDPVSDQLQPEPVEGTPEFVASSTDKACPVSGQTYRFAGAHLTLGLVSRSTLHENATMFNQGSRLVHCRSEPPSDEFCVESAPHPYRRLPARPSTWSTTAARSSWTISGAGSEGICSREVPPLMTRAKAAPRRLANPPSVSSRSPTT